MISKILEFTITMITGGEGGTVQKGLKKVFFPEGWQQIERRQLSSIWSSKKELNWNKLLCKNKWWSRGWDIIPDQNWIQGWRNGVFWTLPQPRELRTLSQGKLKQSGIKQKKTFLSLAMKSSSWTILHQIVCNRPASWLQLWQTHWKKKKASWVGSLWPVAMLHWYIVTCVLGFGVFFVLCLCVELHLSVYVACVLWVLYITLCVLCFCISLSMLHMGFMLDACRSSNSAWHRDDSC